MNIRSTAQLAFGFGGFLRQNVTLEGLTALDGTARTYAEALFRAALRLHFRHDNICPSDSSVFNMIAGGNTSLLLDACFHLFCNGIESTAIAPVVCCQTARTNSYFFFFGASTITI
jgi:hypothetical protein